jgi:hypothetical protein
MKIMKDICDKCKQNYIHPPSFIRVHSKKHKCTIFGENLLKSISDLENRMIPTFKSLCEVDCSDFPMDEVPSVGKGPNTTFQTQSRSKYPPPQTGVVDVDLKESYALHDIFH